MPPNTRDRELLATYLLHMSEKVGERLRKHHMEAQTYSIGLRVPDGWIGDKFKLATPTSDSKPVYQLCCFVLSNLWKGEGIFQVQITALDPQPCNRQQDMFEVHDEARQQLNVVMDSINAKYGNYTLTPGKLLNRSTMPNVIAPAWKPFGHR